MEDSLTFASPRRQHLFEQAEAAQHSPATFSSESRGGGAEIVAYATMKGRPRAPLQPKAIGRTVALAERNSITPPRVSTWSSVARQLMPYLRRVVRRNRSLDD